MLEVIKKYKTALVAIFLTLIIVLVSIVSFVSVRKYKKELITRDSQIESLDKALTNLGDLQKGYVVTKAVRAGEQIKEDMIQEVDVPVKIGLNVATSKDDILKKYFKIGLTEGTIITKNNIVSEKIDNTYRYFDMVIDEQPIGLKVGDYVDIRITFPYGEDFIAIPHKKVEEINSGIMKVVLNESQIYAYQSMLVDKAIYAGTKIYAVQYVDGGAQASAEVYYPLNKNIAEVSALNPNLLELVKQEMIAKRAQVDNIMGGSVDTKDERELENINREIIKTRELINKSIVDSQRMLDRRLEEERIAAERAKEQ